MDITRHTRSLTVAAILAFGVLLSACGDDNNSVGSSAGGDKTTVGNGTDRAFVADMIPHHESAVEMAEIAEKRGQSAFVTELAGDIISSQKSEITKMKAIAAQLDSAGVKAKSLGVPEHEMGMDMDMNELKTAKPFDRAFIDMMVPHHQGAIRMARVELAKGQSKDAMTLAKQIIAAQTREINAMNKHRTAEFGGPSPAGGVPAADAKNDDSADDGMSSGMDHP